MLVVATVVGFARGRFDARPYFITTVAGLAGEVERRVPATERVGSCNAGVLGFMSRRGIINLDGLVNGWDYYRARAAGDLRGYIERSEIRWFADCIPRSQTAQYLDLLGYSADEVDVVYTAENSYCQGLLWHLPSGRTRPSP